MSVKATGRIWDADLPQNYKYVLLSYADHADHLGENIFPSIGLTVWKTGYSRRTVQRITAELVKLGILIEEGSTAKGVKRYRIDFDALPWRPPYIGGVTMTPQNEGGGVTMTPQGRNFDTGGRHHDAGGVSPMTPDPSFNRQKESSKNREGQESPPALRIFCTVTESWPGAENIDYIVERLGERPQKEALQRAYQLWRAKGYRPNNLIGIFDWYDEIVRDPGWSPDQRFKGNGQEADPEPERVGGVY